jgi:hypothetical protein
LRSSAILERDVTVRMIRQERLTSAERPLELLAVIDEAVLRRSIGGRQVMRAQLDHILEAGTRPNITLQVVPFERSDAAAVGGPFTLLRFADSELPDIVYLEQLTNAQYLDKREDVDRYAETVGRLVVEAEPPTRTVAVLRQVLRRLEADVNTG